MHVSAISAFRDQAFPPLTASLAKECFTVALTMFAETDRVFEIEYMPQKFFSVAKLQMRNVVSCHIQNVKDVIEDGHAHLHSLLKQREVRHVIFHGHDL